jgi:hypothetical protein
MSKTALRIFTFDGDHPPKKKNNEKKFESYGVVFEQYGAKPFSTPVKKKMIFVSSSKKDREKMSKHNRNTCKVCNDLRSRYDNLGLIQHPGDSALWLDHMPNWQEKKQQTKKKLSDELKQSNTITLMFKSK